MAGGGRTSLRTAALMVAALLAAAAAPAGAQTAVAKLDALDARITRLEDLNDIEVLFRESQLGFIDGTRFIDKPGYTTVDLFGSWHPFGNDRLELQAAVYNLFDKRYIAHASVADYGQLGLEDYAIVSGLPEPGRNVRLTASVRF